MTWLINCIISEISRKPKEDGDNQLSTTEITGATFQTKSGKPEQLLFK